MKVSRTRLAAAIACCAVAAVRAGVPAFSSDAEADRWLRAHSATYRNMAAFVDTRWGCTFGRTDEWSGGLSYVRDGRGHIDLNDALRGAHRVSVLAFEMCNLFYQDRHDEVTRRVVRGELRDPTHFAMLRESVEYDGLRLHRQVLEELEQGTGLLPPEMVTWASSTATNLAGYTLPLAYDYFKAQEAGAHTAHYLRLFEQHAAEAVSAGASPAQRPPAGASTDLHRAPPGGG